MSMSEAVEVARCTLAALKRKDFHQLVELTCASRRNQFLDMADQSPDQTEWYFQSEDGQAILNWNETLKLDERSGTVVTFETSGDTYCRVPYHYGEAHGSPIVFSVELVLEGDLWRFYQTVMVNADPVESSTARPDILQLLAKATAETAIYQTTKKAGGQGTQNVSDTLVQLASNNSVNAENENEENDDDDYWDVYPQQTTEEEYAKELIAQESITHVAQAMASLYAMAQLLHVTDEQFTECARFAVHGQTNPTATLDEYGIRSGDSGGNGISKFAIKGLTSLTSSCVQGTNDNNIPSGVGLDTTREHPC
eukprot:CFRG5130T1